MNQLWVHRRGRCSCRGGIPQVLRLQNKGVCIVMYVINTCRLWNVRVGAKLCVCAYVCVCVGERAGGGGGDKKTYVCTCVCAYVCRMCLSALFEYVAFRHFVPVKESFVGSEYASVYERMCSSVTLQGWGEREKSIYWCWRQPHEMCLRLTRMNHLKKAVNWSKND